MMLRWIVILSVACMLLPLDLAMGQVEVPILVEPGNCDGCGLAETNCDCIPAWRGYVSAELLWLDRSQGQSNSFVENQEDLMIPVRTVVGETSDLLYNVEAGVRRTIGVEHSNGRAVELRYFGLYDQRSDFIYNGDNLFITLFDDLSTNTGVTDVMAELRSDLHSGELNGLLRPWGRIRPIFGARYLHLSEEWDVFESALTTTGTSAVINNDLHGGQLGMDICLWDRSNWIRVDARVLGAMLRNDVKLNASRHSATMVFDSFTAQRDDFAYAGQIDLTARWQPSPCFAVMFGYTGLWIENVALVTDQSDDFTLSTGAGSIDTSGVAYQGGHVAIELRW